ncbi:DUF309 domain-containing protein [Nonomuraea spiralis]|uniref:DUF309 domain-containing protein n=1 Tax=Nonomuraea spiralis TaxID=46182 RepID=A0ABV5ICD8_9ACTN|nr:MULTISPECIES: DUF309 domain-containing protein [Nonomuraea]RSN01134.1 DUF309 domain-containing protein [Nonomuraea sp. WAC 01424]GGS78256.1 hypothetical protein GCM10010176_021710 [Nonomuraea spiralis]
MRDRDPQGKPRNARPRDAYGRPLPYGSSGVDRVPDDYAPTAAQALADARRFLREGLPFNAHEVFEGRWKCAPEDERELWQGLAQICVGLTHLQRGNGRGAVTLLSRGAARAQAYGGDYDAVGRAATGLTQDSDPGEAVALILGELPD